jgi:hypothetical protein
MLKQPAFAAIALAALCTTAMAQSDIIDDLDADRVSPTEVKIDFEFDGGACQAVEPAEVGENIDGTLTVTFPTRATAETCTMQIVEIEVEQIVPADETVSRIEVVLLGTDGQEIGRDSTDVDDD